MKRLKKLLSGILSGTILCESCISCGTQLEEPKKILNDDYIEQDKSISVKIPKNSKYLIAVQTVFDNIINNPSECRKFIDNQKKYINDIIGESDVKEEIVNDEYLLSILNAMADENVHSFIDTNDIYGLRDYIISETSSKDAYKSKIISLIKKEVEENIELKEAISKLSNYNKSRLIDHGRHDLGPEVDMSVAFFALAIVVAAAIFLTATVVNHVGAVNVVGYAAVAVSKAGVFTDGGKNKITTENLSSSSSAWIIKSGDISKLRSCITKEKMEIVDVVLNELSKSYPGCITIENKDVLRNLLLSYV